ncbi:MAG: hypothetical protein ACJ8F3_08120 [Xanthobacteraceae bacterium]
MPILLWIIYPIAVWSACAGMINDPNADSSNGPGTTDRAED